MKQKFLAICAAAFSFVACNNDEKKTDEIKSEDSAERWKKRIRWMKKNLKP